MFIGAIGVDIFLPLPRAIIQSSVTPHAFPNPVPSFINLRVFLRRATPVPLRIASIWSEASRNLGFNLICQRLIQGSYSLALVPTYVSELIAGMLFIISPPMYCSLYLGQCPS